MEPEQKRQSAGFWTTVIRRLTIKKNVIVALAMLLSATSASLAWTHHHYVRHHGLYNYAPGGAYHERGGPGPRVGNGTGTEAGAESGSR